MKANTTMSSRSNETSGTGFFTWAIILVTAGLLVAMTSDFTATRTTTAPAAHTVQTQVAQKNG